MRISDWSSDVCSSDLARPDGAGEHRPRSRARSRRQARGAKTLRITLMMALIKAGHGSSVVAFSPLSPTSCWTTQSAGRAETEDRQSVGEGKRVSIRLDLCGSVLTQKQNKKNTEHM